MQSFRKENLNDIQLDTEFTQAEELFCLRLVSYSLCYVGSDWSVIYPFSIL